SASPDPVVPVLFGIEDDPHTAAFLGETRQNRDLVRDGVPIRIQPIEARHGSHHDEVVGKLLELDLLHIRKGVLVLRRLERGRAEDVPAQQIARRSFPLRVALFLYVDHDPVEWPPLHLLNVLAYIIWRRTVPPILNQLLTFRRWIEWRR